MPSAAKGKKLATFLGAIVLLCAAAFLLPYRSRIERWYIFLTQFERLPDSTVDLP